MVRKWERLCGWVLCAWSIFRAYCFACRQWSVWESVGSAVLRCVPMFVSRTAQFVQTWACSVSHSWHLMNSGPEPKLWAESSELSPAGTVGLGHPAASCLLSRAQPLPLWHRMSPGAFLWSNFCSPLALGSFRAAWLPCVLIWPWFGEKRTAYL